MKKSIMLLAAILMMAGFTIKTMAQVSEPADAKGEIILALTLDNTVDLQFGKIACGLAGAGGTVEMSTQGIATPTIVGLVAGTTRSAAAYTITGEGSRAYTLTLPSDVIITEPGVGAKTMHVTLFKARCGTAVADSPSHVLDASGTESIKVGATLTIADAQLAAVYVGTFNVTVVYD